MGGNLDIESKENVGTTARFTLPFQLNRNYRVGKHVGPTSTMALIVQDKYSSFGHPTQGLMSAFTCLDLPYTVYPVDALNSSVFDQDEKKCEIIFIEHDMMLLHRVVDILANRHVQRPIVYVCRVDELATIGKLGSTDIFPLTMPSPLKLHRLLQQLWDKTDNRDPLKDILPRDLHQRILVVEDNHVIRRILCKQLEQHGILHDQAVNGHEAIALWADATDHPYDVVLLDVQMPIMGGFEACRRIRAMEQDCGQKKKCLILFVTAQASEADIRMAKEVGGDDILTKPISFEKLKSRILDGF